MVGFTACSTPQPSPKNHTHPKILRYALAQEPNTLDPQKVDASPEATIAYHIYEGLMRSYGYAQLLDGIANSKRTLNRRAGLYLLFARCML